MERVFNFAAGPSALPLPVLEQAQRELLCYPGAGCSVMEMSHRSSAFQEIAAKAEENLRRLMDIPDTYAVLFLQGGASLQFSMVPMNLMEKGATAAYAETGNFAKKAAAEAKRWGKVVTVASSKDANYSYIPEITADSYPPLKADGTVSKGMIPKIENALKAVEQGVRSVTIRSSAHLADGIGTVIRK